MTLTVMLAVVVGLGGLLGLLRGVRAGLVAVAGTLLAAVLVDLWAAPLADWVAATLRPERPGGPTFVAVGGAFALAAGLLGYGGEALLPPAEEGGGWLDRLVGGLAGALNGALLAGYLLRYAVTIWADGWAAGLVAASPAALLLLAWLPWAVLGMLGATGALVAWRLGGRLAAARVARRSLGGVSVAAAPNLAEADRRLSRKIDEALRK